MQEMSQTCDDSIFVGGNGSVGETFIIRPTMNTIIVISTASFVKVILCPFSYSMLVILSLVWCKLRILSADF